MKAYASVLGALLTFFVASHAHAENVYTVRSSHGDCQVSGYDESNLSERSIGAPCAELENARIVQQTDSGYQLTDLAIAMGPGIWQAIEADLPPPATAPRPAYYLWVDVLGFKDRYPVVAGRQVNVKGSVNFAYAGACMTRADMASIRDSVLQGGSAEQASTAANIAAAARAPHSLAAGEEASLKSGSWDYSIAVQPSAMDQDGNVTLKVSGTSTGPTNYDAAAANQCNGYHPTVSTLPIPNAVVSMHDNAVLHTTPLGDIRFHISTQ